MKMINNSGMCDLDMSNMFDIHGRGNIQITKTVTVSILTFVSQWK